MELGAESWNGSHNIGTYTAHFFPWFDEDTDLQQRGGLVVGVSRERGTAARPRSRALSSSPAVWTWSSEPFTDTEAELIAQRLEAVWRYLELLAERVRLESADD